MSFPSILLPGGQNRFNLSSISFELSVRPRLDRVKQAVVAESQLQIVEGVGSSLLFTSRPRVPYLLQAQDSTSKY